MSHRNQIKLVQAVARLQFPWHREPPTTACIFVVSDCLAIPPPPTRRTQSSFNDSCMFLSQGWDRPADELLMWRDCFYSSFCCSFFWKQTGKIESTASTPSTAREFQETASPAVVSLYSVVPALIATKDGGATPVDQCWMKVSQWRQTLLQ